MKILRKIYYWCTKTRLRKILSLTLAVLIFLTSIKYIFVYPNTAKASDVFLGMNEGYGTSGAVNDTNGSVSAGSITNAVWKTEDLCKVGKCLYFDGTGDYVSFADDSDLDMGSGETVTVEGWFRTPDITSGTRTILAKEESTGADGGYRIEMDSSGFIRFGIDNDNSSFPSDSVTTATAFDDNKWHYFSAVKNGSTSITLYVDANLIGTDSSIQNDVSNDDSFYIGIYNGSTNGFTGFIDEVKVLRTARTADEVKADFTGQTPSRGVSASFGPTQDYLSNGLVGYWRMDETDWTNDCTTTSVTDSSGNGNNGKSCPSTTGPDPAAGKFGNGGGFDGSDDIVTVPDSTSTNITGSQVTVSGWFKFDNVTNRNTHLLYKYNNLGGYVLDIGTSGNLAFYIYNGTTSSTAAGGTLTTGQWYNIVGTYNSAGKISLYVNGELIASDNASGDIATSSGGDLIFAEAGWQGSNNFSLDGLMDEVRVYNRTLSPAEVSKLYNWAPGPVGYWKMDEVSSGTGAVTRYDSSGNNNNLTDTNTTESIIGKFGNAALFSSNETLTITSGNQTNLDITGSISMSAWIYFNSTSGTQDIMRRNDAGPTNGYRLRWSSSRIECNMYNASSTAISISTTSFTTNAWYHVACTYDGSTQKIYINGTLEDSDANATGIGTNASTYGISNGNSFVGRIDDAKVYNYARSSGQIIEDMNGGHPAPGSPVGSAVAKWKFDEGYGTTAYDGNISNGGAEDLTLSTASWTNDGKFGKAWNGTGALWASRTNDADLDFAASESFTLSGWFKTDSATNPANGTEYILSTSTGNTDVGYQVYAKTDGTICFAIDDDGTWTDVESCTTTDYYDATWHHFTAVRNVVSDTTKIYIDANEMDSDSDPTTGTLDGNNVFYIGDFDGDNNATAGTEEFAGDIDEVQVFRSALTSDEIKLLYNQSSMAVMGATSTDSSGNASWSAENEYCPPRSSGTCTPPVAEWKMDENTGTTLQDTSGNAYTSTTWTGNVKYAPGNHGSGLYFDGANDVVRIDPAASSYLDTIGGTSDSYTISAWFNTKNTVNQDQAIVYKRGSSANTYPFTLAVGGSPKEISFILNDGTTTCQTNSGTVLVNDGNWHFVSAVWDTTTNTTYVYVDGVLLDMDVCSGDPGSMVNTSDISIGNGRNHTTDGDYFSHDFDGYLDQIRIYNYARTIHQVAWEYNHGKPTINWWKLDDNVSGNGATIGNSAISSLWNINGTTVNGGSNLDCTVQGIRNYGCDLDGTNDNINMGNQSIYNVLFVDNRDFSVAGWFNRDTADTDDTIVGRKPTQDVGDDGWLVFIDALTDKLTLKVADGVDTYTVESSSLFTSTGWNHFVITWDDDTESNIIMYINGIAETVTKTGTLSDIGNYRGTNRNFRIGIEHDGTDNPFNGKLDDIMLFGHAVSDWEVKSIYTQAAVRFGPATGSP